MENATIDLQAVDEFRRLTGKSTTAPPAVPQTQTTNSGGVDTNAVDEFRRLTGKTNQPTSVPSVAGASDSGPSIPDVFLPQSQRAINEMGNMSLSDPSGQEGVSFFNRPLSPEDQAYTAQNQAPGVPLDVRSGADTLTRLAAGAHRNKLEQLNVIRQMHGEDSVRLSQDGQFILRGKDEAGKPKDILVDERNMTAKDFLDLASEYPAFALSMATTKGVPVGKILANALRGAGGYLFGGAATDVAARKLTGQDADMGEIASARGRDAVLDAAFGYGLGRTISGVATLSKMARAAQSKLGDMTKAGAMGEIDAARIRTNVRTGIELEPTLAELTGDPMLLRLESFLSNIPIARGFILKKWLREIENEKAIQATMGGPVDELGERLIGVLGGESKRTSAIAGKSADIVRSQTSGAITDPLEEISGKAMSNFQFGSRMIKRGEAQLQSFKNRANEMFGEIKAQPDSKDLLFETSAIKREADRIRKEELVKKTQQTETVEFDQYGNPRSNVSESEVPIKQLIPTGVDPILSAVDQLPDNHSYFDLVRLRQSIYDRIDSPEPISDRGSMLLKRLGATVTQELKAQGSKVLNPSTRKMIQDANKFYAENVDTFYQKGVHAMLKPRTEAGAIDPERVVAQLISGGKGSVTTYNTLKNFFEKPQAVQDMNRMLRDTILNNGTDSATGLIKLEDLAQAVSKMEPEIVQQLFKMPKDRLVATVQQGQMALRQGTKGFGIPVRGTQSAVEADALSDLLDSGKVDSYAIKKLAAATQEAKAQYSNAVRKAVTENDMGVIEASPETFAKDFLFNPSVKATDVKNVMQSIYRTGDEQLIGDVRRAYFNEIFKNAAKVSKGDPGQMVARIKGTPFRELDPQKLAIQLEDDATRQRMTEILGPDGFEGLKDFALGISGRSQRDVGGMLAGVFTGNKLFHALMRGVGDLPEIAQYFALSYMVTSPKVLSVFRGASKLPEVQFNRLIKSAILTPEFLRVIASDSNSPEEARQAAEAVKAWGEKK